MFTGIVEEVGTVNSASPTGLTIAAKAVLEDAKAGDSIAVNGACLTVVSRTASSFKVDVVPETFRRTDLGDLKANDIVNLERSVTPTTRMGGHFVQGHVDGTGDILEMRPDGEAVNVRFNAPPGVLRYVVEKGFIAIDGTSLTVTAVDDHSFSVTLIPFTMANTTFSRKKVGSRVNLETDILAKYVEKVGTVARGSTNANLLVGDSSGRRGVGLGRTDKAVQGAPLKPRIFRKRPDAPTR